MPLDHPRSLAAETELARRIEIATDSSTAPATAAQQADATLREAVFAILAAPNACIGWIGHWLPLRIASALAMRSLASDPSRGQPAVHTIVFGLAFVLLWYLLISAGLAYGWGAVVGVLGIAGLFLAAQIDLALR